MSANGEALPHKPNVEAMRTFAQTLFGASGLTGLVEVAWTSPSPPYKLEHARLADLAQLDELIAFAASINARENRNMYIGPGLRRTGTPEHARASDNDISALGAFWTDFDKPGA